MPYIRRRYAFTFCIYLYLFIYLLQLFIFILDILLLLKFWYQREQILIHLITQELIQLVLHWNANILIVLNIWSSMVHVIRIIYHILSTLNINHYYFIWVYKYIIKYFSFRHYKKQFWWQYEMNLSYNKYLFNMMSEIIESIWW